VFMEVFLFMKKQVDICSASEGSIYSKLIFGTSFLKEHGFLEEGVFYVEAKDGKLVISKHYPLL
jgi:hypothetical protein